MLSSQEEQAERRRVLANDQRLKEQTGTYLSHTHSDMGGRFAAVGAAYVVGSTALPAYPAAAAHQRDPVPPENPLGYAIDELEPCSAPPVAQAPDPTSADASSTPLGQRTDVGPSSNKAYRRY
jgi:hypothetical protein